MDIPTFHAHRHTITTASGPVAYAEVGAGERTALFVHGVGTSGALWRNVIERLAPSTRCIAVDLPLHGATPAAPDQDFSLTGLARVVTDLVDALGLDGIDLVANDTGGAVAQVVAVRDGSRLRTLTLTNCDTHDNLPPEAFRPTIELAAVGQLAPLGPQLVANPDLARASGLGDGFERPELVGDDVIREFLEPVAGTVERGRQFERLLTTLDAAELVAIEPDLKGLDVPTAIVWGTGDPFFELSWAYWLRDTIAGADEVVELPGARLFFPEERPDDLARCLVAHWARH